MDECNRDIGLPGLEPRGRGGASRAEAARLDHREQDEQAARDDGRERQGQVGPVDADADDVLERRALYHALSIVLFFIDIGVGAGAGTLSISPGSASSPTGSAPRCRTPC